MAAITIGRGGGRHWQANLTYQLFISYLKLVLPF
jgi:hypothetical protein